MRTLDPAFLQQLGLITGTVVVVYYPNAGTKVYGKAAKTAGITIDAVTYNIENRLISLSDCSSQLANNSASLTSVQFDLDDNDKTIKSYLKTNRLEGVAARAYQCVFDGSGNATVLFELIRGRLTNINYNKLTLSLSIDAFVDSKNVIIKSNNASLVVPSQIDKPWPIVFGSALKVPAFNVSKPVKGATTSVLIDGSTQLKVTNPDDYPALTPITLYVEYGGRTVIITGSFDANNVFVISSINPAIYTDIVIDVRPGADPDVSNARVFWIVGTQNLIGQYVRLTDTSETTGFVGYVVGQQGSKIYLWEEARRNTADVAPILLGGTYSGTQITRIAESAQYARTTWPEQFTSYNYTSAPTPTGWQATSAAVTFTQANGIGDIPVGANVTWYPSQTVKYICNAIASSTIHEVLAYRTDQTTNVKALAPVPSSRYTKNLSASFDGKTCTTIDLTVPLSQYVGEGWEDELFVSLTSTVGPNVTDVINWIAVNYTPLTSDTTTKDDVFTATAAYPVGFALFDEQDALTLISDIAYQARLGINIQGGKIFYRYLSREMVTVSLGEEDTILGSLVHGQSSMDSVATVIKANWRADYVNEVKTLRYDNSATLGALESEREFYIYNIESLVKKSLYFYGYRSSRIWKTLQTSFSLRQLGIEVFDRLGVSYSKISQNQLIFTVGTWSFSSEDLVVTVTGEMAARPDLYDGSNEPIYDQNYYLGDPSFPISGSDVAPASVTLGLTEVDYTIPTAAPSDADLPERPELRVIVEVQEDVPRAVPFPIRVNVTYSDGSIVPFNGTVGLTLYSTAAGDILSTGQITLTNGTGIANATITGGTGDASGTIAGKLAVQIPQSQEGTIVLADQVWIGNSEGFTIGQANSKLVITVPESVVRDANFPLTVTGGQASTNYSVQFYGNDNDALKDTGGSPFLTLTTDGSGNFSGTVKIAGGSLATNPSRIGLVAGNDSNLSNLFFVIGTQENTDPDALASGVNTLIITDIGEVNELSRSTFSGQDPTYALTVRETATISATGSVDSTADPGGGIPDLELALSVKDSSITETKLANGAVNLTTKVTGILPLANGGTNSTNPTSGLTIDNADTGPGDGVTQSGTFFARTMTVFQRRPKWAAGYIREYLIDAGLSVSGTDYDTFLKWDAGNLRFGRHNLWQGIANAGALLQHDPSATTQLQTSVLNAGIATSVVGRSANSAGLLAPIQASANNRVLWRNNSGVLAFEQITLAALAQSSATTDQAPLWNGSAWAAGNIVKNGGTVPALLSGTTVGRPAFGTAGRWYWDTDLNKLSRDTGTAWVDLTAGAVGNFVTNTLNTPQIEADITANRNSGDAVGHLYIDTTKKIMHRWNGSTWDDITVNDGAITEAKLANASVNLVTKVNGILPVANMSSIGDAKITDVAWSKITGAPSFGIIRQDVAGNRGAATSYTGQFFYDTGNNTLVRSDGANWQDLRLANASLDLTTKVTGILPIANGGTNTNNPTLTIVNDTTTVTAGNSLTSSGTFFANTLTLLTARPNYNANRLQGKLIDSSDPDTNNDNIGLGMLLFNASNDTWTPYEIWTGLGTQQYPQIPVNIYQSAGTFAPGVTNGVASGKTGYVLGFTTNMHALNAKPSWLRDIKLGMGEGTGTSEQGSVIVVISDDGDYVKISSTGVEYFDRSLSTGTPKIKLDLSTGGVKRYDGTSTFDSCDVATITTSTAPPSGAGKKGQLHIITY